jgi:hypothetical protein
MNSTGRTIDTVSTACSHEHMCSGALLTPWPRVSTAAEAIRWLAVIEPIVLPSRSTRRAGQHEIGSRPNGAGC